MMDDGFDHCQERIGLAGEIGYGRKKCVETPWTVKIQKDRFPRRH